MFPQRLFLGGYEFSPLSFQFRESNATLWGRVRSLMVERRLFKFAREKNVKSRWPGRGTSRERGMVVGAAGGEAEIASPQGSWNSCPRGLLHSRVARSRCFPHRRSRALESRRAIACGPPGVPLAAENSCERDNTSQGFDKKKNQQRRRDEK